MLKISDKYYMMAGYAIARDGLIFWTITRLATGEKFYGYLTKESAERAVIMYIASKKDARKRFYYFNFK